MTTHVLVVDRSAKVRSVLKIYTMALGVSLLEAEDAGRALEMLRLMPIDLVLAEFDTPGMERADFLGELRSDPRRRALPVILLTTEDTGDDAMKRAVEAGADAFLEKPIAHGELTALLRRYLPRSG